MLKIKKFTRFVTPGNSLAVKFTGQPKIHIMRHFLAVSVLLFLASDTRAQYYYKDIISTKNNMAEWQTIREKKIRKIIISSFEADGSPSEGFACEKRFSKDYLESVLFTRSGISAASELVSRFNQQGQLISTSDSSELMVSQSRYSYDDKGRIRSITSLIRSKDDDFVTEINEEHIYLYGEDGKFTEMIRVKNQQDSTRCLFSYDDAGNLAIEKDSKTGAKYYYYYDAKQRLTDVVHMNEYKEQMIPDYQFEYNSAGQLVQMISIEEGGRDYYTWRYQYEDGLRMREKVYSKERKLLGSVEYEYKN